MGILKRLFRNKNENSVAFRRDMAKHLSGRAIKYCTERAPDGGDTVIGHAGSLSIKDDEFIVLSSADIVFRCKVDVLRAWELMSNDGAMLTGPDITQGGKRADGHRILHVLYKIRYENRSQSEQKYQTRLCITLIY